MHDDFNKNMNEDLNNNGLESILILEKKLDLKTELFKNNKINSIFNNYNKHVHKSRFKKLTNMIKKPLTLFTSEKNLIEKIIINIKIDKDAKYLFVPKYALFSPNEVEYFIFQKKNLHGGKNNYNTKTIPELKKLCKKKKIKGYSQLNKKDLIELINKKLIKK